MALDVCFYAYLHGFVMELLFCRQVVSLAFVSTFVMSFLLFYCNCVCV